MSTAPSYRQPAFFQLPLWQLAPHGDQTCFQPRHVDIEMFQTSSRYSQGPVGQQGFQSNLQVSHKSPSQPEKWRVDIDRLSYRIPQSSSGCLSSRPSRTHQCQRCTGLEEVTTKNSKRFTWVGNMLYSSWPAVSTTKTSYSCPCTWPHPTIKRLLFTPPILTFIVLLKVFSIVGS